MQRLKFHLRRNAQSVEKYDQWRCILGIVKGSTEDRRRVKIAAISESVQDGCLPMSENARSFVEKNGITKIRRQSSFGIICLIATGEPYTSYGALAIAR